MAEIRGERKKRACYAENAWQAFLCESGVVRVELAKLNIPDLNRSGLRTDEKIMMLVDCLSDFEKKARFALNNIEQDNLTDELVKSLSAGAGSTVQTGGNKQEENQVSVEEFLDRAYPVGSIYMSVNETSPATLFGGTWVQIQDTFLLASGSSYAAGSTGGEANHTLTVDEMPSHKHLYRVDWTDGDLQKNTVGIGSSAVGVSNSMMGNMGVDRHEDKSAYYTGGSQPHNNMPPYLAVNVWKRTA